MTFGSSWTFRRQTCIYRRAEWKIRPVHVPDRTGCSRSEVISPRLCRIWYVIVVRVVFWFGFNAFARSFVHGWMLLLMFVCHARPRTGCNQTRYGVYVCTVSGTTSSHATELSLLLFCFFTIGCIGSFYCILWLIKIQWWFLCTYFYKVISINRFSKSSSLSTNSWKHETRSHFVRWIGNLVLAMGHPSSRVCSAIERRKMGHNVANFKWCVNGDGKIKRYI